MEGTSVVPRVVEIPPWTVQSLQTESFRAGTVCNPPGQNPGQRSVRKYGHFNVVAFWDVYPCNAILSDTFRNTEWKVAHETFFLV